MKIHSKNNTMDLEDKYVCHVHTKGTNSIHTKLPCQTICLDENGCACTLLYDIILDIF